MRRNNTRPANKKGFELTEERLNRILSYIRAGGHAHVAAEAVGIPKEIFDRWMELGDLTRYKRTGANKEIYHRLWQGVLEAQGQAQLRAEIQALNKDPLSWLKFGPGKETEERRGWSGIPRPIIRNDNRQVNVLLEPAMQGVFASILQVLAPYPEARAAVARSLAGAMGGSKKAPIEVIEHKPAPAPARPAPATPEPPTTSEGPE